MEARSRFGRLFMLQAAVVIYTLSSVMAKFVSGAETMAEMFLYFGLDLFFLGVYALVWQQMLKAIPLSVAYANRAMALLWSAVWAKLIFGEEIVAKQMVGIGLVTVGILLINNEKDKEEGGEKKE